MGKIHDGEALEALHPTILVTVVHDAEVVGLVVGVVPFESGKSPAMAETEGVAQLVKQVYRVLVTQGLGRNIGRGLAEDDADLSSGGPQAVAPGELIGEALREGMISKQASGILDGGRRIALLGDNDVVKNVPAGWAEIAPSVVNIVERV